MTSSSNEVNIIILNICVWVLNTPFPCSSNKIPFYIHRVILSEFMIFAIPEKYSYILVQTTSLTASFLMSMRINKYAMKWFYHLASLMFSRKMIQYSQSVPQRIKYASLYKMFIALPITTTNRKSFTYVPYD